MERFETHSALDRPLLEILKLDWEKAAYVAIFLIAVVTRFWDLGARAMSHDESLHALYSYYLYNGTGYAHNPMMHGPFLFHANALIYFLFGDSDYTARIVPAIFGVFLVMSPLLLRPWLGRLGTLLTSILLLISPAIWYHSRYIRNDIYMAVWSVLMIAALFHFLRDRRPGWLILGAATLMLSLATKETAYIFGYIGLMFLLMTVVWERIRQQNHIWAYTAATVLILVGLLVIYLLAQNPEPVAAAAGGAAAVDETSTVSSVAKLANAILVAVTGTLPIVLVSATLLRSRHPQPPTVIEAIRAVPWTVWLTALIVMAIIYSLLFTTFFTNPAGFLTGIFGSISYWLAQQEVQRGDQPWYYYLLTLTMYEFLPLLFGTVAIFYYLLRGNRTRQEPARDAENEDTEPAIRRRRAACSISLAPSSCETCSLFTAFLVFWTLATLFMYSWAGERMAWLTVHPAQAFIFLTGKFTGEIFERVDWRAAWRRGGALLALLLPISLFGIYTLIRTRPFQGLSLSKLQATGNWLGALVVTLPLVLLTVLVMRRLGSRLSFMVAVATLFGFLALFTVRFAWMFNYVTYDYATELMVFAHGTPDVTRTMDEIAEISRRTVGDKQIKVAYDSDVSWPLEWYMREYPNRSFYGDTPTRERLDAPIVLAGSKIDDKVQPYLGDRYFRFKRRLVWWPTYDYKNLTLKRIANILTTPEKRQTLWNILYYRKYPRSTDDWYYVHNFYMYIRKDVAQQIWDMGTPPSEGYELPPDPYADAFRELKSAAVWGQAGAEPGQFNHPRGVAVGPDGNVYVTDSDNGRVQVFGPAGTLLRSWGSMCNLSTGSGCADPDGSGPLELGDGQFQEPWGITVDQEGRVYVADTWNHRVQVFESDGTFVLKWGTFGQTVGAAGGQNVFYGPRDVAVDSQGRVFVTDTGNKRVVVFDRDGNYLHQWGGGGLVPGAFEEPVGLALDQADNLYVVDTWNRRVQVFDADYAFVREWPVEGWFGESVVNKPYIELDREGRVYVTDPEGYRIAVFDGQGNVVATFGRYGFESDAFTLPTGIAVDEDGYIYVTDTDGQRVIKFEPLP